MSEILLLTSSRHTGTNFSIDLFESHPKISPHVYGTFYGQNTPLIFSQESLQKRLEAEVGDKFKYILIRPDHINNHYAQAYLFARPSQMKAVIPIRHPYRALKSLICNVEFRGNYQIELLGYFHFVSTYRTHSEITRFIPVDLWSELSAEDRLEKMEEIFDWLELDMGPIAEKIIKWKPLNAGNKQNRRRMTIEDHEEIMNLLHETEIMKYLEELELDYRMPDIWWFLSDYEKEMKEKISDLKNEIHHWNELSEKFDIKNVDKQIKLDELESKLDEL